MFCSKCGKETAENATFCVGCGTSLMGGQPVTKKKRLSTAAGIVDIALGGLCLVNLLICLIVILVKIGSDVFIVVALAAMMALCALAIIGGIFALRRRHWAIALAGAIALVLPTSLIGIAAVVLTVMARDEFERKPTPQ